MAEAKRYACSASVYLFKALYVSPSVVYKTSSEVKMSCPFEHFKAIWVILIEVQSFAIVLKISAVITQRFVNSCEGFTGFVIDTRLVKHNSLIIDRISFILLPYHKAEEH